MNSILLAAAPSLMDTVQQTGEAFGWTPQMFLSQVISFAIVAFLLRRFAYKPILGVLEERRRRIEEGQINAEKIKQQLAEAQAKYEETLARANAEAQRLIEEVKDS